MTTQMAAACRRRRICEARDEEMAMPIAVLVLALSFILAVVIFA
jgi:hypothetical protein